MAILSTPTPTAVLVHQTAISSAAFKTSHDTPIEILAAAVSGYVNFPLWVIEFLDAGTTPYANNGATSQMTFAAQTIPLGGISIPSAVDDAGITHLAAGLDGNYPVTDLTNVTYSCATANPATGNGTVRVSVYYSLVSVT